MSDAKPEPYTPPAEGSLVRITYEGIVEEADPHTLSLKHCTGDVSTFDWPRSYTPELVVLAPPRYRPKTGDVGVYAPWQYGGKTTVIYRERSEAWSAGWYNGRGVLAASPATTKVEIMLHADGTPVVQPEPAQAAASTPAPPAEPYKPKPGDVARYPGLMGAWVTVVYQARYSAHGIKVHKWYTADGDHQPVNHASPGFELLIRDGQPVTRPVLPEPVPANPPYRPSDGDVGVVQYVEGTTRTVFFSAGLWRSHGGSKIADVYQNKIAPILHADGTFVSRRGL